MKRSRRFALWTSGIAGVVCLLLLNILVWRLQKQPVSKIELEDSPRSVLVAEHPPTLSRETEEPSRAEPAANSSVAAKARLRPVARAARHPLGCEEARRVVSTPPHEALVPAVAPPHPTRTTLEPIGYVEKADGRVEAVISLGERVEVVHEGEIFEDKFRVAKISPSTVELVENSAPAAGPPLMAACRGTSPCSPALDSAATTKVQLPAEVERAVSTAAPEKAEQRSPEPIPQAVSNPGAARQVEVAYAAVSSKPSIGQELGYVERADGRVVAILAEGEHVRLAQASKSSVDGFRVPASSPPNLDAAKASPPSLNPPDSFGPEFQPIQTSSTAEELGAPPLTPSVPETSTTYKAQGMPGNNAELGTDHLGSIQPEPLAEYSGPPLEPREFAPDSNPASAAPSLLSGEALGGGATPPLPSDGVETQSVVRTLGYVEKAGGEREAIVEVLGQVYLAHEGELFAGKYRALHITPSSVEIVEEPTRKSSLPTPPDRNSEAVLPPIPSLRVPTLSADPSSGSPPTEVSEAKKTGAAESATPPTAPPRHPIKSWQKTDRAETPRAALESVIRCKAEQAGLGVDWGRREARSQAPVLPFEKENLITSPGSSPRSEKTGNCAFFPLRAIRAVKERQTPHLRLAQLRV